MTRPTETSAAEKAWALAALRKSRPQQYEVVERYMRGMGQAAIAAELGVTQGNVSKTLARGLVSLEALKRLVIQRRDRQA